MAEDVPFEVRSGFLRLAGEIGHQVKMARRLAGPSFAERQSIRLISL